MDFRIVTFLNKIKLIICVIEWDRIRYYIIYRKCLMPLYLRCRSCININNIVLQQYISYCTAIIHLILYCYNTSHIVLQQYISYCTATIHLILYCYNTSHIVLLQYISYCTATIHVILYYNTERITCIKFQELGAF